MNNQPVWNLLRVDLWFLFSKKSKHFGVFVFSEVLWGQSRFSFLCMILFYLLFSLLTIQNFGYAFVIVILYALGSMSNPLTVSLATREVAPELQGRLQGAIAILETLGTSFGLFLAGDVLVPAYSQPGQFFGMVFFVPGLLLILSLWPCCRLYKLTGRFNPDRASELQRIG